jgi:hypothetical protein
VRPFLRPHCFRPSFQKQERRLLTCLQHNFPICWLLSNHQTSPPDWTPVLSVRVDTNSVKCDHSLAAQAASVADTFEQACITPRTETGQAGLDAGSRRLASAITACHPKYSGAGRPAPQPRTSSVSIRDLESSAFDCRRSRKTKKAHDA